MIRAFKQRVQTIALALAAWDVVILYVAISLSLLLSYAHGSQVLFGDERFLWRKLLFIVNIIVFNFAFGLYRRQYLADRKQIALRQVASYAFAFLAMTSIFYFARETRIWISALFPALAMSFVGVYIGRVFAIRITGVNFFERRIVVLGTGRNASQIEVLARSGEAAGFACLGFLPFASESRRIDPSRILNPNMPLLDLVRDLRIDEIVVALEERRGTLPTEGLLECQLHGIQITSYSTFMERERGRVELDGLHPSWLVFTDGSAGGSRLQRRVKRILDVVMSFALLVLTLPVMLTTALAIHVEDRGPIFFRQDRIGEGGRPFSLIKFRSMRVTTERAAQPAWTARNDPRVTRVGSLIRLLRIDELPQLYNVLRGEMSLVGPRPEQPAIVEDLSRRIPYYAYRHAVKPGITGWAQINYRYGASVEDAREKLEFDLFYIKNFSLTLDILVLLQTLRVVLWAEGAR